MFTYSTSDCVGRGVSGYNAPRVPAPVGRTIPLKGDRNPMPSIRNSRLKKTWLKPANSPAVFVLIAANTTHTHDTTKVLRAGHGWYTS